MKRLRSYITRLMVTLLVCAGFSLYVVQPVQAGQTSNEFARWLDMMAEASDAPDLRKELQDLKASGGQLSEMLEQASQIVSQNNKEFDFPFATEQASRELYRLLLIEWNQFQTGNAMDGLPVQQTVKPLLMLQMDKTGSLASPTARPYLRAIKIDKNRIAPISRMATRVMIAPMSGGVAIGAP